MQAGDDATWDRPDAYKVAVKLDPTSSSFTPSSGEELCHGATLQSAHLEKFSLNFSSLSFAIRVNPLHP